MSRAKVDAVTQAGVEEFLGRYPEVAHDAARVAAIRDDLFVSATLEAVWKTIDIYSDDLALRATACLATRAQFTVYAAKFVDGEICNGGFHQLFFNSTGILAAYAQDAFRILGDDARAELLTRAMTLFEGGLPPTDRGRRVQALEQFDFDTVWRPFAEPIENEYYALAETKPLGRTFKDFINAHPDEFYA